MMFSINTLLVHSLKELMQLIITASHHLMWAELVGLDSHSTPVFTNLSILKL